MRIETQLFLHALPGLSCRELLQLGPLIDETEIRSLRRFDLEWMLHHRIRDDGTPVPELYERACRNAERMKRELTRVIPVDSPEYPGLLKELYDPPYLLFVRGSLDQSSCAASTAIVGTRKPSEEGLRLAYTVGGLCACRDVTVISGLARGIDTAAHSGVLKDQGRTWAVMGSGFDHIYPAVNRSLAKSIVDHGGALISEYLPEQEPRRWTFPKRNRIISGLSQSVLMIEAPESSGALITVDFALEQGRDVFVANLPAQGNRGLLAQGACSLDEVVWD